jgi:copper chaperone CopZ
MIGTELFNKLIPLISTSFMFITLSFGTSLAGQDGTSQLILRVTNFTCIDCHQAINTKLSELDKNIRMKSDRKKRTLIITYPNTMEDKEIVNAIQKLGYRVGITSPPKQDSEVKQTIGGSRLKYGYCTRSCNASANSWKQLYNRYFAKNK